MKLNATEYTAFNHPHNYPHMAPYEVLHTLRQYDKNNDSFIDDKEYIDERKSNVILG